MATQSYYNYGPHTEVDDVPDNHMLIIVIACSVTGGIIITALIIVIACRCCRHKHNQSNEM
jgi:hypothetical protein